MSAAKVELGHRLFYEADLSRDGTLSCASCHVQRHGFADSVTVRPGVGDVPGRRNAMGLTNVAYLTPLTFADPRQTGLEQQVAVPMFGTHPVEMGMDPAEIAPRLARNPCYRKLFAAAFPDTPAMDSANIARALAAFERTLLSFDAPYDRYFRGDRAALNPAAIRGMTLFFGTAGCIACHSGPAFSDSRYHPFPGPDEGDSGLIEISGRAGDRNRFRTPGLRNAALAAPFLHDGRAKTLEDAIGAHPGTIADAASRADLAAFIAALTDEKVVSDRRIAQPRICTAN